MFCFLSSIGAQGPRSVSYRHDTFRQPEQECRSQSPYVPNGDRLSACLVSSFSSQSNIPYLKCFVVPVVRAAQQQNPRPEQCSTVTFS